MGRGRASWGKCEEDSNIISRKERTAWKSSCNCLKMHRSEKYELYTCERSVDGNDVKYYKRILILRFNHNNTNVGNMKS